jgi:hypothetical protein
MSFDIPDSATVLSLKTYSKVRHMDITDEEERAVIDGESIPQENLKLAGLIPLNDVIKASNDIHSAHQKISGNILLVRKVRLTSPDLFWTAFLSQNKVLGTTSALLNANAATTIATTLTLYLSSTITLLQLIALWLKLKVHGLHSMENKYGTTSTFQGSKTCKKPKVKHKNFSKKFANLT